MQSFSDEELMLNVRTGDFLSFDQLVLRHHAWVWKLAFRYLGDADEAADVVQDAFVRLLEASRRYRPTAKFRTYFYRIITRLCLDRAKKKKPVYMKKPPEIPDGRPSVTDAISRQETALVVRGALDALAPRERMAIVLRYYEGLKYEEIASALETTPKAVERLLARGRDRLRSLLGSRENFFIS